jgi:hypothetical protein
MSVGDSDTSESHDDLASTLQLVLNIEDDHEVFRECEAVVTRSLANWEAKMEDMDAGELKYSDMYLDFHPVRYPVVWGRRPDDSGYWKGELCLEERHEVLKLKTRKREIYGIEIGSIEDFGCFGVAVYCSREGRCYYASDQFSAQDVVGGWGTVEVIDGFDLCALHSDQTLDPMIQ